MNAPKTADFYPYLWKKNKGIFFRGVSDRGGTGFGKMGTGTYVTWDKDMAKTFAEISSMSHKGKPLIKKYKLPENIKLLDWQGSEAWAIRKKLTQHPEENPDDPVFAKALTYFAQKKGYEGFISDDVADGIVVFDPSKMKELKK